MEFKKLKVATARMAGYTGVLGPVRFVDGVSAEYLPRHIRDRMAAGMEFLEVDKDGNEQPAGSQHRLIRESAARAPVMAPLERQTEEEKKQELIQSVLKSVVEIRVLTKAELEDVADKGGIKALREIAGKWNVKHRSIPVLIELILVEQEKWINARNKRLAENATKELDAATPPAADPDPAGEPDPDQDQPDLFDSDVAAAAASGDLSAALNVEENSAETLLGSSVLASTYEIDGNTVQLGEIVLAAFEKSGSSVEEWNELAPDDREDLLRIQLDSMMPAAE